MRSFWFWSCDCGECFERGIGCRDLHLMFRFFCMRQPPAEEPLPAFTPAEWNQWVDITLSSDGLVKHQCTGGYDNPCQITWKLEEGGENQQDQPHEFQCIAQFKAGLRIVCYGDESHIQHGLTVEPAGFDRVFPQDDSGDDAERCGQHARRVDSCQAEAIDGKFQDQQLEDEWNIGWICDLYELQPGGNPPWILHKEQPGRCQQQGEEGDHDAGQPQVGSCHRRKIVVVGLLYDIEYGGRQNHGGGRIVHQDDQVALQDRGGSSVRSLRKTKFWKWIQPLVGIDAFRQTFLVHGEGIDLQVLDPFFYELQQGLVHPVAHIAEGDVGVGALPGI